MRQMNLIVSFLTVAAFITIGTLGCVSASREVRSEKTQRVEKCVFETGYSYPDCLDIVEAAYPSLDADAGPPQ